MGIENLILEACVENLAQSITAERKGANRLELCGRLDLDGLTPDVALVNGVMQKVQIPVKVMIRPRGGDFVHSDDELKQMSHSIDQMKAIGVQEIVLGILDNSNKINLEATRKLTAQAYPMKVTFHKAIDELDDPVEGVRQLSHIKGIGSVLTSGGMNTAEKGKEIIVNMIKAAERKLEIIAAGKVTNDNLSHIHKLLGAREYHGKLIVGDLI